MERIGDLLSAAEVVRIAKKYKADITPDRQIRWMDTPGAPTWIETLQYRPSVLDAVILELAPTVGPSYLEAAQAATAWNRRTLRGFLEVMLTGGPNDPGPIYAHSFNYWRGIITGIFVYTKLRRH